MGDLNLTELLAKAEAATPRDRALALYASGMPCNCDLDRWQPELSTGHSRVCRIHRAARDLLSTLQEIKGVGRAEGRDLQAAAIHVVGADQDRIELLAKHDPDIFRDVARWALRSPS